MNKQNIIEAIDKWEQSAKDVLKTQEYIKTFDNPPKDIEQRVSDTKECISFLNNLKYVDILELVKNKIQIHEQDGFYWIQISNDPMTKITKEQYDLVKEWLENDK